MRPNALVAGIVWIAGTLALVAFTVVCGDMAVAPDPGGSDGTSDDDRGGLGEDDVSLHQDGSRPDSGGTDGGKGDAGAGDTGAHDTGTTDTGSAGDGAMADDAAGVDAGGSDSSFDDIGVQVDAGVADTGTSDTGQVADTGSIDAGSHDAGVADAGQPDGGHPDIGQPDAGHPDGGAAVCTLNTGMPACNSCIAQQCTSECTTCQGNPACLDVVACGLACDPNDMNCLDACASQHSGGASDGVVLYNCASGNCTAECLTVTDGGTPADAGHLPDIGVISDGGSAACNMSFGSPACTTCFHTTCSSQCQACAFNADCGMALLCIAQCPQGSTTCMYGCVQQYPGATSLIMALYNCLSNGCAGLCGL